MGWFGTIMRTVQTVSGALGSLDQTGEFVREGDGGEIVTPVGEITFIRGEDGEVTVENESDSYDFFLYFSRVKEKGQLENASLRLKRGLPQDVTQLVNTYVDGIITAAPLAKGNGTGTLLALTAEYVIQSPTIFTANPGPEGHSAEYEFIVDHDDKAHTWQITFTSKEAFDSFELQFTDRNGIQYYLRNGQARKRGGSWISYVNLPRGANHRLPFMDVKIQIHLDDQQTEVMFPGVMTLLRKIEND
ncbi:MAG: hypothetical protein D3925_00690 [Candidatus Electrothrix sp. AR5]|nr:hypothetical protein [Candidatus Electrothrix sp. AR5]